MHCAVHTQSDQGDCWSVAVTAVLVGKSSVVWKIQKFCGCDGGVSSRLESENCLVLKINDKTSLDHCLEEYMKKK